MDQGFYHLEPDPPMAGQPLTVRYSGDASELTWKVDGGGETKVTIPPREFEIGSLPSGGSVWLNDHSGNPDGIGGWPIDNPETVRP